MRDANKRDQKLDEEYNNLMAELGGGTAPVAPAPWAQGPASNAPWQSVPGLENWQGNQIEGGMPPMPPMPPGMNGYHMPPPNGVPLRMLITISII